jgi:non-canonical (house-cleaning) NTP pyrophosphatase
MKIAVGSLSPIKLKAVQSRWPHAQIISVDSPSGVSEQPYGHPETLKGAYNRAKHAFEHCSPDFAVGIESGLENSKDFACIIVYRGPKAVSSLVWTEELQIPPGYPPGPNGRWAKSNDPHLEITGRERGEFILDALIKVP